jgi:hypothetical protein
VKERVTLQITLICTYSSSVLVLSLYFCSTDATPVISIYIFLWRAFVIL